MSNNDDTTDHNVECDACYKSLSKDELGLSIKLLPIGERLCLDCLCDELGCERDQLEDKIKWFKMTGCVYFL